MRAIKSLSQSVTGFITGMFVFVRGGGGGGGGGGYPQVSIFRWFLNKQCSDLLVDNTCVIHYHFCKESRMSDSILYYLPVSITNWYIIYSV